MEPFTIQCSTCQSKIRVKSARMLGQVANCPKCNSMILVTAPEDASVASAGRQIQVDHPGGAAVDSMAMTKEGIEPGLASSAGPLPAAEYAEEYRLAPADETSEPAEALATAPAAQTNWSDDNWSDDAEPLVPSDAWTSASSAKTRQYLLVGFLGFTSVALAAIAFIVFLRWYGSEPTDTTAPVAVASGDPQGDTNSLGPTPNTDGNSGPDLQASESGEDNVVPGDTDSASEDEASPILDDAAENTSPAGDESQPVDLTDASAPPADPSDVTFDADTSDLLPGEADAPAELPADLLLDDSATTDNDSSSADALPLDPKERAKQNLPNANLKEFAPVLDWQVQPVLSTADVPTGPPPVTAEDLGLASTITRTPVPTVDLNEHLKKELPGLILPTSLPLATTINLWCHLSGVPVYVDLESIDAANIDVSQTPDIGRPQQATLGAILNRLANGAGLELESQADQYLVLRATSEKLAALLPESIVVSDLIQGEEQAQWLIGTLSELIPGTLNGWSIQNGTLSYDSTQMDLLSWARAIRLLESWRAERKLPTALSGYTAGHMRNAFVSPQQIDALRSELSEVMLQEAPVGQTLSRICRRAGLNLWIDWPNAGKHGLGPMTSNLVILQGRTLEQVLANYATEYGLVFCVQDANNLCLTTPTAYRSRPELFVIPSQGKPPEQWQQQLRLLTPTNAEGIRELKVVATPDQEFVIVSCCRPTLQAGL